jgi:hypothetical protein
VGLKFARGDGDPVLFELGDKVVVELLCPLGFSGIGEGGPASFAAIAEQCELRDHQYGTLDINQRKIEFSFVILKDPELGDLGSQVVRIRLSVLLPHAEEAEEASRDLANAVAFDGDPGLPYPLDDGAYGFYPSSFSCWVSAMIRSVTFGGTSS